MNKIVAARRHQEAIILAGLDTPAGVGVLTDRLFMFQQHGCQPQYILRDLCDRGLVALELAHPRIYRRTPAGDEALARLRAEMPSAEELAARKPTQPVAAAASFLADIELRRIDDAANSRRFWACREGRTLTGGFSLEVVWGRLGKGKTFRLYTFDSREALEDRLRRLLERRAAHGYSAVAERM